MEASSIILIYYSRGHDVIMCKSFLNKIIICFYKLATLLHCDMASSQDIAQCNLVVIEPFNLRFFKTCPLHRNLNLQDHQGIRGIPLVVQAVM